MESSFNNNGYVLNIIFYKNTNFFRGEETIVNYDFTVSFKVPLITRFIR